MGSRGVDTRHLGLARVATGMSDEGHGGHGGDGHGHGHSHDAGHGHDRDHDHGGGAHHHDADPTSLGVGLLTVSSSRTLAEDTGGDAAVELLEAAGHEVVTRELVPDGYDRVQSVTDTLVGRSDVDLVVTTGGTGVTPDDVTVEAVRPLFDREVPGFGELFRAVSREEVGTRAMHSRATAGVSEGVPVFVLPGSEGAVRTAVRELVVPEGPHLVAMAGRERDGDDDDGGDGHGSHDGAADEGAGTAGDENGDGNRDRGRDRDPGA